MRAILTNNTFLYSNLTEESNDNHQLFHNNHDSLVGSIYLIISCIFFGITYLPLKFYKIGDCLFYQFLVGIGIWSSSLLYYMSRRFPNLSLLPMFGGFLWSIGYALIDFKNIQIFQNFTNILK